MTTSRILEKIKKCLALADSDNPGEAAAGLRQAQKLMEKHNLTSSDLRLSEVTEVVSKSASRSKSLPTWVVQLRVMIGGVFGAQVINRYQRRRGVYHNVPVFIGLGDRPQAAQYTYEVLFRQISADRRRFKKELPSRLPNAEKTRRADLFCEGWTRAVRHKVEDMAVSPEDEALVERFKKTTYKGLKEGVVKSHDYDLSSHDISAIRAGAAAGEEAQLFRGVGARDADKQVGAGQ